jgi:hypothetical protein
MNEYCQSVIPIFDDAIYIFFFSFSQMNPWPTCGSDGGDYEM